MLFFPAGDLPRAIRTHEDLGEPHIERDSLFSLDINKLVFPSIAHNGLIPPDGDIDIADRDLQTLGIVEILGMGFPLRCRHSVIDIVQQGEVFLFIGLAVSF